MANLFENLLHIMLENCSKYKVLLHTIIIALLFIQIILSPAIKFIFFYCIGKL